MLQPATLTEVLAVGFESLVNLHGITFVIRFVAELTGSNKLLDG